MSELYVGCRVVCIGKSFRRPAVLGEVDAVIGEVYTVRELYDFPSSVGGSLKPAIRLVEIVNPVNNYTVYGSIECRFWQKNFAPVRSSDQSIERENEKELEDA